MCESPNSLQNLCVSFISENLYSVFDEIKDELGNTVKFEFKNSGICLPPFVSELLFSSLDKKILSDLSLTIFDSKITRLQRVFIQDASNITTKGLRNLRAHKISELSVIGLNSITVNDLIGCLGDWTLENLRTLNVSCSTFVSSERVRVVIALSKLRNLRSLDVSFSEFNSQALEIVAEDLPVLESLNISGTLVTDISPLKKCKDRLKFLDMHNLKLIQTFKLHYVCVLDELKNLKHLDISDDKDDLYGFNSEDIYFFEFLKMPTCLPLLESLDISGKDIDIATIKVFMKNHRKMRFLGLLDVETCRDDMFCNPSHPMYNKKLIVTGHATEEQILASLYRYMYRKAFLQKCLCNLYVFIQNLMEVRLDFIKIVLQSMRISPQLLGVQIAATACLYILTKSRLSTQIHPIWLKQIVDLTLVSMENFPKQAQLQKNSLLTLCSDRMLDDVSFNKYRCAELVMNALMVFNDVAMNRMSVAICSILAARISTAEASNLGANESYMTRLLKIVESETDHEEDADIMMKFTLSALWNLTDESPRTCNVFLKLGGMQIFLNVLNKFPGNSHIETKVLGLMNNIAEVPYLRKLLITEEFIFILRNLLHSEHIDVSYFAAGIVAHVASDGESAWDCQHVSWEEIVSQLGTAVHNWQIPETEMVSYRSFNPFYPLFLCKEAYEVQLWAAWAIHHVCSKNPQRYCHMILEEGGVKVLEDVISCSETHESVGNLCKLILHFIKENSKPQPCIHHIKKKSSKIEI